MMNVKGNSIYLTRGDSASITVSITDSNGVFVPIVTGDTVYFTVKTSINTSDKILQKTVTSFTNGKAYIEILPSDTKNLNFSQYIYDIQITRADGTVSTIISPSVFKIEGEVTYE